LVAIAPEAEQESERRAGVEIDPAPVEPSSLGNEAPESPLFASRTATTPEDWIEEDQDPEPRRYEWAAPALAIAAIVAWTTFFAWVHQQTLLTSASPAHWANWIINWSIPVLLVAVLWLVAMRNSQREAARFGRAAKALAKESSLLERRLSTVNRELSLARDFIAAQSRDLESLGRVAGERLSQHADRLQSLIRDNGAEVEVIGRVSSTAVENMDRLRNDLPVISNSARDVASQIGHAGGIARQNLDELIDGFGRLNQFGEASGRQITSLRAQVEEALVAFSQQAAQLEEIATARFAALAERSVEFRAELDGREVDAFAAIHRRADALREELKGQRHDLELTESAALNGLRQRMTALRDDGTRLAELLRHGEHDAAQAWTEAVHRLEQDMQDAFSRIAEIDRKAAEEAHRRLLDLSEEAQRLDRTMAERAQAFEDQAARRTAEARTREAASLQALEDRLATLDAQIVERQQEHLAHVAGLAERGDALAQRLTLLSSQMEQLYAQGRETEGGLAQSALGLADRLAESRALLEESGSRVAHLTEDSVRLLELIRSSATHTAADLPQALAGAEQRLLAFEQQAGALAALIAETGEKGLTLAGHVEAARQGGTATLEQLQLIEQRLAELARTSSELAEQARTELTGAIASLELAAGTVVTRIQDQQAAAVRTLAGRIADESSVAIDHALLDHARQTIAQIEEAARHAGQAGRETVLQLRDQLAAVDELAGNLEHRVAHARERAQEQVGDDFARRMALITDSLNSNAIDITKAFATDVSDTAWTSYLRGDRGIFTRRAVRLLGRQEARSVAQIYEADADFHETVNRYIHDFEAMLRSVLSTRDGHALAVTLLSSDMGKLYVALAQSIERLRA
jgi:hypothetical protein